MLWLIFEGSAGGTNAVPGLSGVSPPGVTTSSQAPWKLKLAEVPPYSPVNVAPRTSRYQSRDRASSRTTRMWVSSMPGAGKVPGVAISLRAAPAATLPAGLQASESQAYADRWRTCAEKGLTRG